jgi:predicted MFS family arabinose efflux permease
MGGRFATTATLALAAGALILTLAMGIRQSFGLFLGPVCLSLQVGREAFGLALAVQNLLWGAAQPFAGALADRFGAAKVLIAGALCYAGGLAVMGSADSLAELHLGGGFLLGIALSCVSFAVVLGAVGRAVPAERRSSALGIASAGGSFGQFVMAPVGQELIATLGWQGAFFAMAALALAIAPLAVVLARTDALRPRTPTRAAPPASPPPGLAHSLGEAGRHRGYWLLTTGFFVCGFQVVFIGVHLPAYLADLGMPPGLAAEALALIGFFNIIGTWGCGALGAKRSKKRLLAALYLIRSVVIALFLASPKSEASVLVFAAAIGLLWLGTVPLTSGLVGQIFGVSYLSTLFGIVFFGHQVGSFLGAWLGGRVFEATGSYDPIWYGAIVLGVAAALLHLPIAERPLHPAPA